LMGRGVVTQPSSGDPARKGYGLALAAVSCGVAAAAMGIGPAELLADMLAQFGIADLDRLAGT